MSNTDPISDALIIQRAAEVKAEFESLLEMKRDLVQTGAEVQRMQKQAAALEGQREEELEAFKKLKARAKKNALKEQEEQEDLYSITKNMAKTIKLVDRVMTKANKELVEREYLEKAVLVKVVQEMGMEPEEGFVTQLARIFEAEYEVEDSKVKEYARKWKEHLEHFPLD